MPIHLLRPRSEDDWRRARLLVEEYAASLPIDLSFQDFARELDHLAAVYAPPSATFLLAEEDAVPLGCVGVRKFSEGIAEMKRLYVVPAARRRGVGRRLAVGAVDAAREIGYARIRLDTLATMTEALALYGSLGFVAIPAYRFNPVTGAAYLERVLL